MCRAGPRARGRTQLTPVPHCPCPPVPLGVPQELRWATGKRRTMRVTVPQRGNVTLSPDFHFQELRDGHRDRPAVIFRLTPAVKQGKLMEPKQRTWSWPLRRLELETESCVHKCASASPGGSSASVFIIFCLFCSLISEHLLFQLGPGASKWPSLVPLRVA